jgi:hypothetical protein
MRVGEGDEGPYLAEQPVTRDSVLRAADFTRRGTWQGAKRMIRVIIDTVLFSCMAAMVTGVVIVAASLLI